MRRREIITLLGGAAAVSFASWPLAALAQPGERVCRIGVLIPYPESDAESQTEVAAFRETLQQLGWAAGRNLRIDYRRLDRRH
jgi:hypothetical protein